MSRTAGQRPTAGEPSAAHGRGKRWRARYVDDQGRERAQGFVRKTDAQAWLSRRHAQFVTGTYVAPEAGQVAVAAVYASWAASQGHIAAKTVLTRRSAWNKSTSHREWAAVDVVDVKTSAVRGRGCQKMAADSVGRGDDRERVRLAAAGAGRRPGGQQDCAQPVRWCEAAQA